jgi:hypothetical protein
MSCPDALGNGGRRQLLKGDASLAGLLAEEAPMANVNVVEDFADVAGNEMPEVTAVGFGTPIPHRFGPPFADWRRWCRELNDRDLSTLVITFCSFNRRY